jgi:hypothetical protein
MQAGRGRGQHLHFDTHSVTHCQYAILLPSTLFFATMTNDTILINDTKLLLPKHNTCNTIDNKVQAGGGHFLGGCLSEQILALLKMCLVGKIPVY